MSVLILDNKRILLNGIRRYELNSDKLYYRNGTEEKIFFIWLINENELWSEYSFKYLFIKMDDGKEYKFVSDSKLKNLMKEMDDYFKVNDIDLEEVFEENENLEYAIESYMKIKDSFIFVKEDISYIANKMDYAFGTI